MKIKEPDLSGTYTYANYLTWQLGEMKELLRGKIFKMSPASGSLLQFSLVKAELNFCLQNEVICSLQDLFIRRTGLMYFDIKVVKAHKSAIAEEMNNQIRLWRR